MSFAGEDRGPHGGRASPLAGVRYSARAHDLVRFLDDPVDEEIARIVGEASRLDDEQRGALRSSLSEDDAYTLLAFARRRAVSALRTRSEPQALEAILGLTLITRSRIDYRDLRVDFPLYAVRELGGDVDAVVGSAAAPLSEPGTGEPFAARAELAQTLSLRDCALLEVKSSYGLGYMDVSARKYSPTADIAETAVRLADMIDAEGTYVVEKLDVSDLRKCGSPPPVARGVFRRLDASARRQHYEAA